MEKKHQTTLLIFVAGFIIGFIIGSSVFYKPGDEEDATPEETTEEETTEMIETFTEIEESTDTTGVTGGLINVKDQEAGMSVFISRVELETDGWVAIQELENGVPTNTLGARRFDAGIHQGTVSLLRETQPGGNYQAILYTDNGDKEFSLETDEVYTDRSGNTVTMQFETY